MEEYRLRVKIFIGVILVVLGILGLRLVKLQLIDTSAYSGESRNNAIREHRVLPARGLIYDRNNVLMVDNEPTYTITLTPRYFNRERIGMLATLLEVSDSLVTAKLDEARRWSAFKPSPSFREVPFDVLSRVLENRYLLPGVSYEVARKRRYLTDARASHAFGYVREITRNELERRRESGYRPGDLVGQAGLEKNFEDNLRGRLGSEFKLVNVHGLEVKSYLDGEEDRAPESGYDLHLTLDSKVQALAESLFVNKRGGAVAFDPRSGGIIAFLSQPDYDPELFSQKVSTDMWRYLMESEDKPLFNRATQSQLPPGSTWKPFMALMALQEGLITPETHYSCGGGHPLGKGRRFRCMHVHGSINVHTAIEQSCNTFFFEMMRRADVNTFSRYAHMFGFGERAAFDISEQDAGLIPDSSYYNRAYPRGWTIGYSINLGIGQGDMGVTPMQLARYMATIANAGTLHSPRLVSKMVQQETGDVIIPERPPSQRVPIDAEYFELVRNGMRAVMEEGTGRGAQIPGIPSGGKTGTAQNPRGKDDSVFILFAPYDDPQIAVAVLVENIGYGGTAAAPIASLMAEQYLTGEITRKYLVDRMLTLSSDALTEEEEE